MESQLNTVMTVTAKHVKAGLRQGWTGGGGCEGMHGTRGLWLA